MPRFKPPLDGFYWEDIVFVPARRSGPPRIERVLANLGTVRAQLTLVLAMVGALTFVFTLGPRQPDRQLASVTEPNEPETTGTIQPALRPTLPD
jgi:hypothetical protein